MVSLNKALSICLLVSYNLVGSNQYEKVDTDSTHVEMIEAVVVSASAPSTSPEYNSTRDRSSVGGNLASSEINRSSSDDQKNVVVLAIVGAFMLFVGCEIIFSDVESKPYTLYNRESNFIKVFYRPEYHTCKDGNADQDIIDCMEYIAPNDVAIITSYGDLIKLCATYDAWDSLNKKCADEADLKKYSTWCVHDDLTFTHGECPSSESVIAHNSYNSSDLTENFTQSHLRGSK